MGKPSLVFVVILFVISVLGCTTRPPRVIDNSCEIFREKKGWYKNTKRSVKRWGVPIHVQLAIIHQESKFRYKAKPPRQKLLWFIPWFRPSSAYGYAQALDETWERYIKKTGNWGADRYDFGDVSDFIGWYGDISYQKLGISKWDAYNQYLAYHEGHGGFKRKTYLKKPWLIKVARKVEANADRYSKQLSGCRSELDKGWSFWPF